MLPIGRWFSFATGFLVVVLTCAIVLMAHSESPQQTAPAQPPAAKPGAAPAQAVAGEYVGDDAKCIDCHDRDHGHRPWPGFKKRSPAATAARAATAGQDACRQRRRSTKILNRNRSHPTRPARCAPPATIATKHALWDGSQHDQRTIGCLNCHSVHSPKGEPQLKAKDESTLCASCHRTIVHKQLRFNHMPVREGKMTCSSCHNVHGTSNVKLLKAGTTIDESCATATPRSGGRSSGITRRWPRAARPVMSRTGRTTSACSSPRCRSSASAAT